MKIIFNPKGGESPLASQEKGAARASKYSGDYHGAFSIERFYSAPSLSYTHEDATGWFSYLENFNPRNFWYKDGNVKPWAYYEDYDNWQDTYGMDAVLATYHSGHGNMDTQGVFSAPMGGIWGNLGSTVYSDKMKLGNEQANYIFWSTCLSLRVLGNNNPIRTWASANKGFRMLFGYETTSYDDPDYGKNFWQEWNKGKSFSTAFLDASWRIAHDQAPSVVACGKTRDEAYNRVFNERLLYWDHVDTSWWWWRWYYASSRARAANSRLPEKPGVAELRPALLDEKAVKNVLSQFSMSIRLPSTVMATRDGIFHIQSKDKRISFAGDGAFEIQLSKPNLTNTNALASDKALDIANATVKRYVLDKDVRLTLDCIYNIQHAGGTPTGSGAIIGPFRSQTVVVFKQLINGVPVTNPGQGEVAILIDNDEKVNEIRSSTRQVERLNNRPKNTTVTPDIKGPLAVYVSSSEADINALLDQECERLFAIVRRNGDKAAGMTYEAVPDSQEVGYIIRGNEAYLVAHRSVEVEAGGYRKKYRVQVPLLE